MMVMGPPAVISSKKKNHRQQHSWEPLISIALCKYMQKDPSKTIEYLISHTGGLQTRM